MSTDRTSPGQKTGFLSNLWIKTYPETCAVKPLKASWQGNNHKGGRLARKRAPMSSSPPVWVLEGLIRPIVPFRPSSFLCKVTPLGKPTGCSLFLMTIQVPANSFVVAVKEGSGFPRQRQLCHLWLVSYVDSPVCLPCFPLCLPTVILE